MKTLLCATLLSLSTLVSAQSEEKKVNISVNCFERGRVMKALDELKEKIVFAGIDTAHAEEGILSFMSYNKENEEYTIGLLLTKTNLICIIGGGKGGFLK